MFSLPVWNAKIGSTAQIITDTRLIFIYNSWDQAAHQLFKRGKELETEKDRVARLEREALKRLGLDQIVSDAEKRQMLATIRELNRVARERRSPK